MYSQSHLLHSVVSTNISRAVTYNFVNSQSGSWFSLELALTSTTGYILCRVLFYQKSVLYTYCKGLV